MAFMIPWGATCPAEIVYNLHLNVTVGEIVVLPCNFEAGEVRNIYWKRFNGSHWNEVATFYQKAITTGSEYTGRVHLDSDTATLTIQNTSRTDHGCYRCKVDRIDNNLFILYARLDIYGRYGPFS